MLCHYCQEIFTGERNLKLKGSLYPHLYWLPDLMAGVQQRCFICSALKRALTDDGKLHKSEELAGVYEFVSEYFMKPGTGDLMEVTFKFRYSGFGFSYNTSHQMFVRPWNGTELFCSSSVSRISC